MLSNNDVIRRLRYVYDFRNKELIDIFKAADYEVSFEKVEAWTKKDEAEGFVEILDIELSVFLDGFINTKRGKKEGLVIAPLKVLDNNTILRKLKIGLNFKDDEMIRTLALAGKKIGKSELSAFFRKPGHKHYRECQDQILRNFLKGLAIKERAKKTAKTT